MFLLQNLYHLLQNLFVRLLYILAVSYTHLQAATNRVREMQKKAMQNNEKHDKNTNTQKDIQNNKKATKSAWSDGSSITYTDNTNNTKYPVMPDFVTPISETRYKNDAVKSTKSSNNKTDNTKYISTCLLYTSRCV